jgi:excisionase family DNA binding protein
MTQKINLGRRLMTTREACDYLSSSPWKIRKLVQDGLLVVVRMGDSGAWRFDRADLDALIERSKRTGPE